MTESKDLRVFVVDDEHVIASTLAAILNKSGLSASAFTSPLEALESARVEAPDMVISDVVMPKMTGIELGIELRTLYPKCKVLLFSGQAGTANLLGHAKQLGHDFELLSKPVHPRDLLAAIRTLQG